LLGRSRAVAPHRDPSLRGKTSYGIVALEPLATAGGVVRAARRIATALLTTVLTLAVLGLALRIYLGREAEDRLAPGEMVGIAELNSPLPKASFLACPPGYCSVAEAIMSPVFNVPWERLRGYWQEMIAGQAGILRVVTEPRRFVYIQHSPVFRFPDIVTVEFVPIDNRSSIAVYSRSRYGEFDFAKNRKRVEKWLFLLQKVARPATARPGGGP
jgi:hypothetical protein